MRPEESTTFDHGPLHADAAVPMLDPIGYAMPRRTDPAEILFIRMYQLAGHRPPVVAHQGPQAQVPPATDAGAAHA